METVAMRIPKNLKQDVREFAQLEKLDQSTALRKILETGLETWRLEIALKQLEDGKITTSKAAEIARISIWDMVDIVQQRGTVLPIKADDIIADIDAITKRKR